MAASASRVYRRRVLPSDVAILRRMKTLIKALTCNKSNGHIKMSTSSLVKHDNFVLLTLVVAVHWTIWSKKRCLSLEPIQTAPEFGEFRIFIISLPVASIIRR